MHPFIFPLQCKGKRINKAWQRSSVVATQCCCSHSQEEACVRRRWGGKISFKHIILILEIAYDSELGCPEVFRSFVTIFLSARISIYVLLYDTFFLTYISIIFCVSINSCLILICTASIHISQLVKWYSKLRDISSKFRPFFTFSGCEFSRGDRETAWKD